MNRVSAIKSIVRRHDKAAVIFCNGLNSREACYAVDRPGHFYLLHGMGEALSVGMGLRLVRPDLEVVVIDGDGNAAMGMAEWVLLPRKGLHYYVLVNAVYETTGAQTIPGKLKKIPGVKMIRIHEGTIGAPVPRKPMLIKKRFMTWLKNREKGKP